MSKPKCKFCNKIIEKKDRFVIIEKTKNGNVKKINLHEKCIKKYNDLMEYKANELKWFDEIYEYIKQLFKYDTNQKLPRYIITNIQDLRNGTIMIKGKGRVVKSKEGYPYDIIMDTLLQYDDSIIWAFNNKSFKTEKQKFNYMMAIVEDKINDVYLQHLRLKESSKYNQTMQKEEVTMINNQIESKNIINKINKKNSGSSIISFLEKDEF